jgi:hypothetical protein
MRLRGVLDQAFGGFPCLRGYGRMGDLYAYSEPDESYQRDLIDEHYDEMVEFLDGEEFLFFPELILGLVLSPEDEHVSEVDRLFQNLAKGKSFKPIDFGSFEIQSSVSSFKSEAEARVQEYFHRATLKLEDDAPNNLLKRIDGNHRLAATPEKARFADHNVPFCILLFRRQDAANRQSRVLFHNINYKQIPLTMEQNLELIIDDKEIFYDNDLRGPSFGWPYYLTRKLHGQIDLDMAPELERFFGDTPRTFLLEQFQFLIDEGLLAKKDEAADKFKSALVKIHGLLGEHPRLSDCDNSGFIGALLYYTLKSEGKVKSFINWVLANHLYLIDNFEATSFVTIFNQILQSKKRTIFMSMPFGSPATENHFNALREVCTDISREYDLNPPLKAERVDWFSDGTSYDINDQIFEMIADSGLLIGDLTGGNVNVYNEIGFVMGRADAQGLNTPMLLILNESEGGNPDSSVGFNLRNIKQERFETISQLKKVLKENLKKHYNLIA